MTNLTSEAKAQLLKRFQSTEAQKKFIEELRKKRKQESFIRYWQPWGTNESGQLRAVKSFTKDIKIFGLTGGNRSGKTELGTAIVCAFALGKKFFDGDPAWDWVKDLPIPDSDVNIWCVGLTFQMLKDVIWQEKLRQGRAHPGFLPQGNIEGLEIDFHDSDFQVFINYKGRKAVITGKSADAGREKFQAASVDLIHIDEECEEAVFDECYQRTSDCAGKLLLTLTPLTDVASGVRSPWVFDLYQKWKKGEQKDVKFVSLSVLDNPYVPDDEKEKLKMKWAGHPEERARLYGDFITKSGLVYPMWNSKVHMIRPFVIPGDWTRIVSIDPAATGVTAAVWAAIEPKTNNIYLTKEYYQRNLVVSDHAKGLLVRNAGDPVDLWLIDPYWARQRNNETHKTGLQLYREAGVPVRSAEVDEGFTVIAAAEYLNATLDTTSRHPKVYVFDSLHNFQTEIESYVWDTFGGGPLKGLTKEKPMKKNDHLMNAFQYLCAQKPKGRLGSRNPNVSQAERSKAALANSYT